MTRPLQEILDNAEALADAFENMGPDDIVEVWDGAPLRRILAAAQARAAAEHDLLAAVTDARGTGLPWTLIGSYLGTSGEAARQRYGTLTGPKPAPAKRPARTTKKAAPAAKKAVPAPQKAASTVKKAAPAKKIGATALGTNRLVKVKGRSVGKDLRRSSQDLPQQPVGRGR
ncbi:MAG TPA: hypothetical protein VHV82_08195 [Sporichthyaceae bacterium]|jgi:hypothetical protein|nr:hypothetical protein [Sporichthyaceae bacterium]